MSDIKVRFSNFDEATSFGESDELVGLQNGVTTRFSKNIIKGYKSFEFLLSLADPDVTMTILNSDFSSTNFSIEKIGTGLLIINADSAVFTIGKTFMVNTVLSTGVGHCTATGSDGGEGRSTTTYYIEIYGTDNENAATPTFTNQLFEIRVYN